MTARVRVYPCWRFIDQLISAILIHSKIAALVTWYRLVSHGPNGLVTLWSLHLGHHVVDPSNRPGFVPVDQTVHL